MQVLKILSDIWKSGADIYLDDKDGRIAIKRQELIPAEVMKEAELNFQGIDDWFQSWKSASNVKITLKKILHHFCVWQHNEKLHDWLRNDEKSISIFYDWTVVLAKNGWNNLYEDYRKYENEESDKLAQEVYNRAVEYTKKKV